MKLPLSIPLLFVLILPSEGKLKGPRSPQNGKGDDQSINRLLQDFDEGLDFGGHGTPDEMPPPMESICDSIEGQAKGLCTAYCEAQDCDMETEDEKKKKSCEKIRDKFLELRPDLTRMPCENKCPCWEGWEQILEWEEPVVYFQFHHHPDDGFGCTVGGYAEYRYLMNAGTVYRDYICWYMNRDKDEERLYFVTEEEFRVCLEDILYVAKEAGNLKPGSIERSACQPFDDADPSILCPCWDGSPDHPAIAAPGGEFGELTHEMLQTRSDHLNPSSVPYAISYTLEGMYYKALKYHNGAKVCEASPVLGGGRIYLSEEQFKVCYNDLLQASAMYGNPESDCTYYYA